MLRNESKLMKKVLIVSRRLIRKDKPINWVSEIYLELFAKAGVMPIIVPIAEATKEILDAYLADYDGMMMMEGGDVGPHYYDEAYPINELEEYDAIKDTIEIKCCQDAINSDKPLMGFCRGLHIINALHKGKIHKDIHDHNKKEVMHINYDNYDGHRHKIKLVENTPLIEWYKQEELQVNTYHHQGIMSLGEGLVPMAYAEDGLIEAVYNPSKKFLVGLQFHPERMLSEHIGHQKVFDAFLYAVKEN